MSFFNSNLIEFFADVKLRKLLSSLELIYKLSYK